MRVLGTLSSEKLNLSKTYDVVIVGAGIVGLSTARELATSYPQLQVLVLEKEQDIASHQTGHNSGVIHSGIYYRPGSLKAQFCVQGAAEMVRFCQQHNVPHEVCGKVIVAIDAEQRPALEELHRRAISNGVANVRMIGPQQLREIEPHSSGIAALQVPGTGIAQFRRVAEKYAEIATVGGCEIVVGAKVLAIKSSQREFVLQTTVGDYRARWLINCAGLYSDKIAQMAGARLSIRIMPFRGEYYHLKRERSSLVRTLIYPVPDPRFPFLGVHFTKKTTGEVEAGPNAVLALSREGYRKSDFQVIDAAEQMFFGGFWKMAGRYWKTGLAEMYRSFSKAAFVKALQALVPEIEEKDLGEQSCGVRAQALDAKGNLLDDFHFVSAERALHVCNVPSPAATASLPIARHIASVAAREFQWL